jgi:hypothetical protein
MSFYVTFLKTRCARKMTINHSKPYILSHFLHIVAEFGFELSEFSYERVLK